MKGVIEYLREIGFPTNGKDNPALREKLYQAKIENINKELLSGNLNAAESHYLNSQKIRVLSMHGKLSQNMIKEVLFEGNNLSEYLREIGMPVNGKDNPALRERRFQETVRNVDTNLKTETDPSRRRMLTEKKIRLLNNHGNITDNDIKMHTMPSDNATEYIREMGLDPAVNPSPYMVEQKYQDAIKDTDRKLNSSSNPSETRELLEKKQRLMRNHGKQINIQHTSVPTTNQDYGHSTSYESRGGSSFNPFRLIKPLFKVFVVIFIIYIIIVVVGFIGDVLNDSTLFDPKYKVTLDYNNGEIDSSSYLEGETVNLPTNVVNDNFIFYGWDSDSTCENPITSFVISTEDVRYYACYEGVEKTLTVNNVEALDILAIEGENVYASNGQIYSLSFYASSTFYMGYDISSYYSLYKNTYDTELQNYPSYLHNYIDYLQPDELIYVYDEDIDNSHSVIWTNNRLLSEGYNIYGQLGNGNNTDSDVPVDITNQIGFLPGEVVIDIESGWWHTILLTSNGRVFTFGDNHEGQLGLPDNVYGSYSTPIDITNEIPLSIGERIVYLYTEGHGNFLVSNFGKVYIFGSESDLGFFVSGNGERHPSLLDDSVKDALQSNEVVENVYVHNSTFLMVTSNDRILYWCYDNNGFYVVDITNEINANQTNTIQEIERNLLIMSNGDIYYIYFDYNHSYPDIYKINIYGIVSSTEMTFQYATDILSNIEQRDGITLEGASLTESRDYEESLIFNFDNENIFVKWTQED